MIKVRSFWRTACVPLVCFLLTPGARAETEIDRITLTISGTVYMTPQCTVNNNNPIEVNFGVLKVNELETSVDSSAQRNRVAKSVPINCGDTLASPTEGAVLSMTITPKEPSFNSALLGTSDPGLGVLMMAGAAGSETIIEPGKPVAIGTESGVPLKGTGSFLFTPVANSTSLPAAGSFSGTASLTIDYQ